MDDLYIRVPSMLDFEPDREPRHPGWLLAEIVLPTMRVSVARAARQLGLDGEYLQEIVDGRRSVTAETAVRLAKYAGNRPEMWLQMQQEFDLWHAKRALADIVDKIPLDPEPPGSDLPE